MLFVLRCGARSEPSAPRSLPPSYLTQRRGRPVARAYACAVAGGRRTRFKRTKRRVFNGPSPRGVDPPLLFGRAGRRPRGRLFLRCLSVAVCSFSDVLIKPLQSVSCTDRRPSYDAKGSANPPGRTSVTSPCPVSRSCTPGQNPPK